MNNLVANRLGRYVPIGQRKQRPRIPATCKGASCTVNLVKRKQPGKVDRLPPFNLSPVPVLEEAASYHRHRGRLIKREARKALKPTGGHTPATLAAGDFNLLPVNPVPSPDRGRPFTLVATATGSKPI